MTAIALYLGRTRITAGQSLVIVHNRWNETNAGLLGALVVYSVVVDPKDSSVYAATPYGIFKLEAK